MDRKLCIIQFEVFLWYLKFMLILMLSLVAVYLPGQGFCSQSGKTEEKKELPWRIEADKITYDQNTKKYLAVGSVVISKGNKKLTADRVSFYHKTMKAVATGHVLMIVGEDILSGDRLEMDLENETGTVFDASVFLKENHFYIRSDQIHKTGKYTYEAKKASLTSCDGESPAWKITGKDVAVTIEGFGTVHHAALWAKNMPVFYTPYMTFPVKLKRQTGFLTPQMGYSERKGLEYNQPFFWAINENSDATFYGYYMGRRGTKIGAEYRYMLSERSKGAVMFDVMDDREVDDGTPDNTSDWGYKGDSFDRPRSGRSWFRMKHDQELPNSFFAHLDLDIVSDQDYLREFKDGYSGFNETDRYFLKTFGRELDDYNDPVRVNRLNIYKNWSQYALNAEARWYDNVIARRYLDTDTTLHKLPYLSFNALKQPVNSVSSLPVFYDMESEYIYFFREDGYTGHRMDVHPRLYTPLRYKNYFSLEPSVGVRETVWYLDDREDESLRYHDDRSSSRELVDARLDLSTELKRSFDVEGKAFDKIKHTIRPRITYEYIPPRSQRDLPDFDDLDRLEKESMVTYSITNTFSKRTRLEDPKTVDNDVNKNEKDMPNSDIHLKPGYMYKTFGRLKLEQGYDFNEHTEDRPLTPVFIELDFLPVNYFSLQGDAEWCTYDNSFLSCNTAMKIADNRGDRLFVEHRYTRDELENFYGDITINIHDRLSMFTQYEKNIENGKDVEYGFGFLYMSQCWSLDIGYYNEEGDHKYAFMINLYGLGGLGSGFVGKNVENPFEYN